MIKSMTGFGRCEIAEEERRITVEMKAVNHRYLDIAIKMPKKLNFFESAIRNLLKNYIQRGKVDVYITYEDCTENQAALKYNEDMAAEYVKYIQKMADTFSLPWELDAAGLSKYPEVLTMEARTIDEQELWKMLEQAVTGAVEQFVDARLREGQQLREDLLGKLEVMFGYVEQIEARSPEIVSEYRQKLTDKVNELLTDAQADENRILTEVTIFADKICTDEETVRLRSHISGAKDTLTEGGAVGRKLDFIAQEMNREANTILSKSNDLTVSDIAINLKTDIEKVREQIQNIE
ncbi:MAG: YicC family protein [Lachnospiraceae bacterium]|nr:YicC family protein [Lachnospiraceae bacterium]